MWQPPWTAPGNFYNRQVGAASSYRRMQDVEQWAVMTIGTGLGDAHVTNRAQPDGEE